MSNKFYENILKITFSVYSTLQIVFLVWMKVFYQSANSVQCFTQQDLMTKKILSVQFAIICDHSIIVLDLIKHTYCSKKQELQGYNAHSTVNSAYIESFAVQLHKFFNLRNSFNSTPLILICDYTPFIKKNPLFVLLLFPEQTVTNKAIVISRVNCIQQGLKVVSAIVGPRIEKVVIMVYWVANCLRFLQCCLLV